MSINTKEASILIATALFLTGCETVTSGQGVLQNVNGTASETVSFSITESFGDNQASVVANFASGESYTGKFIISKSETSSDADIWDTSASSDDLFITSSSTTHYSKATGVLFGPSGKTMECGLTLASPSIGFSGGGVGKCKLSTGQIIPMQLNES